MQDATILIYQALGADSQLITLLGTRVPSKGWNRVYNDPLAPHADEDPRLTMFEVLNDDANSADDEPQDSDVNIRIDYWTKDIATIYPVCKRIKEVIKGAYNACTIRIEETIYEDDTKIYHKPINIFLLLEQESE